MKKRILAFVLVLALIGSMLPMSVLAEPADHTDHQCEHCEEAVTWTAWGDDTAEKTTLPTAAGHYYLTQQIKVSKTVSLTAGEVTLCLNGQTITASGTANSDNDLCYSLKNDAVLTITDCTATQTGDTYTAGKLTGGSNGAILAVGTSKVCLYDGIFTGNGRTGANSGAIRLEGTAKFYMYGGEMSGNTSYNGGAVFARGNNDVQLLGGAVTGNTAKVNGAVYLQGASTLLIGDCTITGNTTSSASNAGGVYALKTTNVITVTGKAYVAGNNGADILYAAAAAPGIQIDALENGAKVVVTHPGTAPIAWKDASADHTATPWDMNWVTVNGQHVGLVNGQFKLGMTHADVHDCEHCDSAAWTAWGDDAAEKTTLPSAAGHYYLTQDIPVAAMVNLSNANVVLCLNGKTVTAPSAARIYFVKPGATLSITDCTAKETAGVYTAGKLTGGTVAWGSVFSVDYGGTVDLYDGLITDNGSTAANGGIGVFYLRAGTMLGGKDYPGGRLNMYGGAITGNQSKTGTIYMAGAASGATGSSFYLYGGKISCNTSTDKAGAIYATAGSIIHLEGGKITENSAKNSGGGIYAAASAGKVTVTRKAVVTGNTVGETPSNLHLDGQLLMDVADLEAGAAIGISASSARVISSQMAQDYASYFTSDNSLLAVVCRENRLQLVSGHQHNVCADSTCADHESLDWASWSNEASLPTSGSYYLTQDVVLTGAQAELSGDLDLCLNGHTVTAAQGARMFFVKPGTTLSITDCGTTGCLTGGNVAWGSILSVDYQGVVNLYGGTVTGSGSTADSGGIGAIYLRSGKRSGNQDLPGGRLNMYGGTITGNEGSLSGAIYMAGATGGATGSSFYMYGGKISGNASTGSGGAIYATGGSIVSLYGGKLENNTAATGGGAVYMGTDTVLYVGDTAIEHNKAAKGGGICVDGDAKQVTISGSPMIANNTAGQKAGNLHLGGSQVLTIENLSADAKVGITADAAFRAISGAVDAGLAGCFTSDRSTFYIEHKDGKLYLGAAAGHEHCVCDGVTDKCDHRSVTWAAWEETDSLPTEGTYYLTADVKLANTTDLTGDLLLCLNGHTVTAPEGKRVLNVTRLCVFRLTDCAEKPGVITGGTQTFGAAISIRTGGTMHFYGGKFSGNTNDSEGGAIYLQSAQLVNGVEYPGAKFYMYGGEISGNTALTGGGISVASTSPQYFDGKEYDGSMEDPVLHIYGGRIVNNTATGNGGGIYTRAYSSSILYDGEISGNRAALSGGGVYVYGACQLQLLGGMIQNNTAGKYGGGVHSTMNAVVDLQGTPIRGNTAGETGGGVGLSGGAELRMTGSEISGNTATHGGGVIVMSKGLCNLQGGRICKNTAADSGGGVFVSLNAFMTMGGGEITQNSAKINGGGVYLVRAEGTFSGGKITGNKATNAGGMYFSGSTVYLKGTKVDSNSASKNGGGIVGGIATSGTGSNKQEYFTKIIMESGSVSSNYAEASAGGILIQNRATLELRGGSVSYNHSIKDGAGIYASTNTFFDMHGGTVAGNKADGKGAGMYLYKSKINVYGGVVEKNETVNGAGIYVANECTFNMYNCTIRDNYVTNNGAGMYVYKATANLYGGTISGNYSEKAVGGMLVGGATAYITIKNVKFYDNSATGAGALVIQGNADGLVENCEFYNNEARTGSAGAIYISNNSYGTVRNCNIHDNTGKNGGAYFVALGATGIIEGSTFERNHSEGAAGAIYCRGNLTMTDCVVRDNSSVSSGGGIGTGKTGKIGAGIQPGLIIKNSVIENNTAGNYGGGIHFSLGCDGQIYDCTVQNNTAGKEGGGIWAVDNLFIHGVTVTGNTAGGEGYGIYLASVNYDGHSYQSGLMKMCGNVIIRDNEGGDLYLGETTTIAGCAEGLGQDTYIHITLDSGVLTDRFYAAYNYDGENCDYIVTCGDRSLTDPEASPTASAEETGTQEDARSGMGDLLLYIGVGIFVAAILAVAVVLLKKKKAKATKE